MMGSVRLPLGTFRHSPERYSNDRSVPNVIETSLDYFRHFRKDEEMAEVFRMPYNKFAASTSYLNSNAFI